MKTVRLNRIRLYQSVKGFDGKQHNHFAVKEEKADPKPGTMEVDMYLHDHLVYIQDRKTKQLIILPTTNIGEMEPLLKEDIDSIVNELVSTSGNSSEKIKNLTTESKQKAGAAISK